MSAQFQTSTYNDGGKGKRIAECRLSCRLVEKILSRCLVSLARSLSLSSALSLSFAYARSLSRSALALALALSRSRFRSRGRFGVQRLRRRQVRGRRRVGVRGALARAGSLST